MDIASTDAVDLMPGAPADTPDVERPSAAEPERPISRPEADRTLRHPGLVALLTAGGAVFTYAVNTPQKLPG